MNTLPPGLAGWVAADQMNRQKQAAQLQELQGILSLQQGARQQEIQEKMLPLQMQLLQAQAVKAGRPENPFAKIDPSKFTPDSIKAFIATGGANPSVLEPVRNLNFQNTGPNIVGLDPVTGQPRTTIATGPTAHQSWQQNTQFPWTQQVDRSRLANDATKIGIDNANLFFNTGMAPMGGGSVPRLPGAQPSAMDGVPPAPIPRPMAPVGVAPPRGAPAQQQNFVPPNAQIGQPGVALPPKALQEIEIDRRKKAGEMEGKRDFILTGIGSIIAEAEALLAKGPTSSGIGAGMDMAGRLIGYAPPGAREAAQLEAVGGALVAKMPRMEGPQSDFDVQNYRAMAGQVGDKTLPIATRKAALDEVKRLWAKYDKEPQPAGGVDDIANQVRAAGIEYQPSVYEYRIHNGQVQRKKR
jgi:hypothetical protein